MVQNDVQENNGTKYSMGAILKMRKRLLEEQT
jgi:hypothetical protein